MLRIEPPNITPDEGKLLIYLGAENKELHPLVNSYIPIKGEHKGGGRGERFA